MNYKNEQYQWIVEPLLNWYKKNARVLPWRENADPYRVWVSEIMLQQTRVDAVIAYFNRFMEALPTIQDLANAEEAVVLKLWEGLGYYSRARNLKKTAEIVCNEYGGNFPTEYKELLSLPGIGKYTVGSISSIAFGLPRAAVDGNVLRVITRLEENSRDIMDEKFRREIAEQLEKVYPTGQCSEFTQSLMELGAMICVPNGAPKCEECPLKEGCRAHQNNTWEQYPVKKEKPKRKKIDKTVFLLHCGNEMAIEKGEDTGLLAGLWKFPNVEQKMKKAEIEEWLSEQSLKPVSIEKAKKVKHIFTHIEWHMQCYVVQCKEKNKKFNWVSEGDLEETIALPTAYKKCL
jgi:A/G-specific adenine glycosylase